MKIKLPAEIESLRNKEKDFSYFHRQDIKFGITEMEAWYGWN